MAKYSKTSPYYSTPQSDDALDLFVPRTFAIEDDDQSYTIERTYAYRPDLDFGGCSHNVTPIR